MQRVNDTDHNNYAFKTRFLYFNNAVRIMEMLGLTDLTDFFVFIGVCTEF